MAITPYITVIVDGGGSHRSHGPVFPNSGVAVIIGERTKKLLYIGVRNKLCSTCEHYSRTGKGKKDHVVLQELEPKLRGNGVGYYRVRLSEKRGNAWCGIPDIHRGRGFWHCTTSKAVTCKSPAAVLKRYASKKTAQKANKESLRRKLFEENGHQQHKRKESTVNDSMIHYGPNCQQPDMPPEEYAEKERAVLASLQLRHSDGGFVNDARLMSDGQVFILSTPVTLR
ncbi:hypothetical protein HPB51_023368 [Rhipicephalus microplus]|uniref:Mutator-like transposase domain-containing protein n=1 Tax=Rhipicephalus microplus TaxID=6941 RepID=A0A9J6DJY9_RHIMP|nr:hypothetical protein HPB51_023368 [Rhipicephalus microplus]